MTTSRSQEKFRRAVKKALVDRDLTVTDFAKQIGFARNTVSMAINRQVLPTVRRKIAGNLKLEGVL